MGQETRRDARRGVGPAPARPPAAQVRRARRINRELARLYPDASIELNFTTPLELLVAAILSARATDRKVNEVTPALFTRYRAAGDYAAADPQELERLIRPTGFFQAKARRLIAVGQALCDRFGGEVPDTAGPAADPAGRGPQDRPLGARECLRPAEPRRGYPLCPAGPAVWLDRAYRPGQDRARCRRAAATPGMDPGLAPADLARPPGLPCPPARMRRLRSRGAVPVVRHRASRRGNRTQAGPTRAILVTRRVSATVRYCASCSEGSAWPSRSWLTCCATRLASCTREVRSSLQKIRRRWNAIVWTLRNI